MTDSAPIIITSANRFGSDLPDPDVVPENPLDLLALWLPPKEDELRPLMTLSTVGEDGYPDSRHLLLSAFDGEALHFHTVEGSRKVAQLDADGRVSLALVWVEIGRQLTVVGDAVRVSEAEATAAFEARSRYLKLLAWMNTDEVALLTREQRVAAWAAFADAHPDGTVHVPSHWVGYKVVPRRLTFWRGDAEGPSNRVEYLRTGDGWDVTRLPG